VKQEPATTSPDTAAAKAARQRHKERTSLEPLVGRRHVRAIGDYLAKLRLLYPHPNRVLFYDDVVVAYLLAFFNPALRSLRCLEDMSQVPGVNRFLSVEAIRRSTLSEANALFDPAALQGLIRHVRDQLPRLGDQDATLPQLVAQIVCFDGSFFRVAGDVQWALWHRNPKADTRHHLRLNCMYCQATGVPAGVSVSGDDGLGEGAAALALLTADETPDPGSAAPEPRERIYLFDSGVVSFDLLQTIHGRQEHFLCNLRDQVGLTVEEERELTAADRAASVASDRIGRLTGSPKHPPPEGRFREIIVPYVDRNGRSRHVRLLTNLLEVPAHVVAELYRYRWQIELFFRWLKVHARFRHLMSFSRKGVTSGFYIAVLGAMLLCFHSQQPLNKYALNLFGAVAAGLASPEDVLPILARRAREKQLERERRTRNQGQKNGK